MCKVILRSIFHGGRKLTLSYSLGSVCSNYSLGSDYSKTTVWAQTVVTTVWDSLGQSGTVWDSLGPDCYSLSPCCKVVATAVARSDSTVVVTTAAAMHVICLLRTFLNPFPHLTLNG